MAGYANGGRTEQRKGEKGRVKKEKKKRATSTTCYRCNIIYSRRLFVLAVLCTSKRECAKKRGGGNCHRPQVSPLDPRPSPSCLSSGRLLLLLLSLFTGRELHIHTMRGIPSGVWKLSHCTMCKCRRIACIIPGAPPPGVRPRQNW